MTGVQCTANASSGTDKSQRFVRARTRVYIPESTVQYYSGILVVLLVTVTYPVRARAHMRERVRVRMRTWETRLFYRTDLHGAKLAFDAADNFQDSSNAFRAALSGTSCRTGLPSHFTFSK